MADPNEQIETSTDAARAGSTPGVTRYVLAASLVLIVVVFAILFFHGS